MVDMADSETTPLNSKNEDSSHKVSSQKIKKNDMNFYRFCKKYQIGAYFGCVLTIYDVQTQKFSRVLSAGD